MVSWRSTLSCVFELSSKHLVYCFDHQHGGLAIKLLQRRPVQFYLQYSTFIHSRLFQTLTSVLPTLITVTSMWCVVILQGPTHALSNQDTRVIEGHALVSLSDTRASQKRNPKQIIFLINHFPMFKTYCSLATTLPQTKHDFYLQCNFPLTVIYCWAFNLPIKEGY